VPVIADVVPKMNQHLHRQCFTIADRAGLEALIEKLDTKTAIYFGRTSERYPSTDYGCIVTRLDDGRYSYIVEGHGIGSNEKPPSDLDNTIRRVFADCQRLGGGDTVTIEITGT
jgi:hypothetical protein